MIIGASSPRVSLARTSLRTPELSLRHRREHAQENGRFADALRRAATEDAMETNFPCVAGLDVPKATVVACLRRLSPDGNCPKDVRTFSTMTASLLELLDWLAGEGVTHVAMES